jgi:hypothetical protein
MSEQNQGLDTLKDIKQMMERSSRFISLSGLSGISAGLCALAGAWWGSSIIKNSGGIPFLEKQAGHFISIREFIESQLFQVALVTFMAALVVAFFFTWLRSRKNNLPIWEITSRRLLWNVALPMVAGGLYLLKLVQLGYFGMVAPGCLIFYGLALVNASKYTLGEVRWLGYGNIMLGIISCWYPGYGIYFWAAGFGILHIVYGALMWWKYERVSQ